VNKTNISDRESMNLGREPPITKRRVKLYINLQSG